MPEIPTNAQTRIIARRIQQLSLQADEVIEIRVNNQEVMKLTIPQNKTFRGFVGIDGVLQ